MVFNAYCVFNVHDCDLYQRKLIELQKIIRNNTIFYNLLIRVI